MFICVIMCAFKLLFTAKLLLQTWQLYGFSPVCVLIWSWRPQLVVITLLQTLQLNLPPLVPLSSVLAYCFLLSLRCGKAWSDESESKEKYKVERLKQSLNIKINLTCNQPVLKAAYERKATPVKKINVSEIS